MGTPATLDDVMEAVCNSRAEGDEALAASGGAVKLDSEEFLRHCADTYYRGEGYVPVGVPVLDTRAFYDVLRSGGWAPQWSRVYSGLWVPAWMQPLLRVAADGAEAPDPSRVERLVREVARALWRPASDATIQAVLAAVGWPPAWRVRHPLELDILTTLDGPAAIRACLESRGVRVVVPPPEPAAMLPVRDDGDGRAV